MGELSIRGIARRFRNLNVPFYAAGTLVQDEDLPTYLSSALSAIANQEIAQAIPDCGTVVSKAYLQVWSHIVVRVRAVPINDLSTLPTPLEQWKQFWKMGIEAIWNREPPALFPDGAFHKTKTPAKTIWSDIQASTETLTTDPLYWTKRFVVARDNEIATQLRFELQWVDSDEHHQIKVGDTQLAKGTANESSWTLLPTGEGLTLAGAAHEFGHMLGLGHDRILPNGCEVETPDVRAKYENDPSVPDLPWNRSVMCAISVYAQVPQYLVSQFGANVGSHVMMLQA